MQNWIDLIVSNAAFFVAFFVFVVFVVGFVIAMFSEAGRAALGRIAALAFAERWLCREIDGEPRGADARHLSHARAELAAWREMQ
jgi:hypothetical protein